MDHHSLHFTSLSLTTSWQGVDSDGSDKSGFLRPPQHKAWVQNVQDQALLEAQAQNVQDQALLEALAQNVQDQALLEALALNVQDQALFKKISKKCCFFTQIEQRPAQNLKFCMKNYLAADEQLCQYPGILPRSHEKEYYK